VQVDSPFSAVELSDLKVENHYQLEQTFIVYYSQFMNAVESEPQRF